MKRKFFSILALALLLSLLAGVALADRAYRFTDNYPLYVVDSYSPSGYCYMYDRPTSTYGNNLGRYNNGETLKSGRHTLKSKTATKRLPEEYTELRNRLSERFSTKVQMTCSQQGKGKISIPFASEEELERIITLLDKI